MHILSNMIEPAFEVILLGQSHDVRLALGCEEQLIDKLPFSVGRRLGHGERAMGRPVDLALPDRRPYQLSRCHFAIIRGRDGLIVVDTGSRQGTIVNDVVLGQRAGVLRAHLPPGNNSIIAGGPGSPFRFTVSMRLACPPLDRASGA